MEMSPTSSAKRSKLRSRSSRRTEASAREVRAYCAGIPVAGSLGSCELPLRSCELLLRSCELPLRRIYWPWGAVGPNRADGSRLDSSHIGPFEVDVIDPRYFARAIFSSVPIAIVT